MELYASGQSTAHGRRCRVREERMGLYVVGEEEGAWGCTGAGRRKRHRILRCRGKGKRMELYVVGEREGRMEPCRGRIGGRLESCGIGERKDTWSLTRSAAEKVSSFLGVLFNHTSRADRRILYRALAGSEADGSAERARLGPPAFLRRSNA